MFSSRLTKKYAFLVFSLHILGTLLFSLAYNSDFLVGQLQNLCYIFSVLLWAIRIKRTILSRHIRNILIGQCSLILFWYIVRMCKFTLFQNSELLNGYFWYLYYVPIIFIAVFGFFTSMLVDKNEKQSKDVLKNYSFVFVIGIILVLFVLTNNFHKLVFVFENNPLYDDYTYNIVYYCIVAFEIPLHLLTFLICTKKSVNSVSRNMLWIVPVIYLIFIIYLVLYGRGMLDFRDLLGIEPVKFPEVYIFFTMLIWETYLQIGLIPVNTGYDDFVKNSSLSIRIENGQGETFLVSKGFEETESGTKEKDIVMHSVKSGNKIVSWLTDVRDINALAENLNEINGELSVENEITEQKLELARKKKAIEQQSLLYDKMYYETQSQITKINDILENIDPEAENFNKELLRVCVLGAYVKRRSNLILISEKNKNINIEELAFCFRETIEYLNLCGIVSSFYINAAGEISGETAGEMYECFEDIVEVVSDTAEAVMLTLERKKNILTLCIEISAGDNNIPVLPGEKEHLNIKHEYSDDTLYVTIAEKEVLYET